MYDAIKASRILNENFRREIYNNTMRLIGKIGYDQISEQIINDGFLGGNLSDCFMEKQELIKLFRNIFGSWYYEIF